MIILPLPLIEHLCSERDVVIKKWLRAVGTSSEFDTPNRISTPQLLDHVPNLLDDLADFLRKDEQREAEHHARIHGQRRWEQQFRLDELLRELLVLRDVVIDEVEHFAAGTDVARAAGLRVVRFFDNAMLFSAIQFAERQQAQVDEDERLLAAHHQSTHTELKAVDAARLRLLRVIAHELRNLLNAATLTAGNLFGESDPEWLAELQRMLRNTHSQMTALVNQLLDVAPLLAGRDPLRLADLDLRAFVADQGKLFSRMAESKRLEFRCSLPENLPNVVTDEAKLQRVVTNLVQNALKYTPSGGSVSFGIESVEPDRWRLMVTDTGPGIPTEHRTKIFEEFHRVPGSEREEGTGLGLSIVHQLVSILHGEIDVDSEVGRGSTFVVTLPCNPNEGA